MIFVIGLHGFNPHPPSSEKGKEACGERRARSGDVVCEYTDNGAVTIFF